jgi:oligopeptide transport system ATP-binding protein
MPAERLLVVDDLCAEFAGRTGVVKAVDGVSFELGQRETLCVVGESGSGKSSLALSLPRLLPPGGRIVSGDVRLRGRSLVAASDAELRAVRGASLAMVFQDPLTSLNPVYRVGRQIAEPLMLHRGLSRREAWSRAAELLRLVGISDAESRVRDYPHQLSGGMRQRVMVAIALSCDPEVLIADEPTTALDVTIQAQLLELIAEWQARSGAGVILVSHDLGVVAEIADTVLVMYAGRPVEFAGVEELFYRPLHPYTWGLLASVPSIAPEAGQALVSIPGQPPSLSDLPSGCAFHPRCPHARTRCRDEIPAWRHVAGQHAAACHFAGEPGFSRAGTAS